MITNLEPIVIESNSTEIFSCKEFGNLTVIEMENEPWFIGNEVAGILGYEAPRNAISNHVDEDDRKTLKFRDCTETVQLNLWKDGDYTNKTLINESGLYSLVLSSKLDGAKRFKRWVTKEVLPSIRKHGAYMTPDVLEASIKDPKYMIGVLTSLAKEQEARIDAERRNKHLSEVIVDMTPTVEYADLILQSTDTMNTTQIGVDYGLSAKELNKILHNSGVQYRSGGQWILYAKYKDKGYVDTKTVPIGVGKTTTQTVWTQKGRKFIYEILKEKGIRPLNDEIGKQLEMEV